jgi:hypothetical protein
MTRLEYVIRFVAGGMLVSAFAALGDMLRPKSFAGLFGAAPSVALATLGPAFWRQGGSYVAIEGRSMVLGAIALAAYGFVVCQLLAIASAVAMAGSYLDRGRRGRAGAEGGMVG